MNLNEVLAVSLNTTDCSRCKFTHQTIFKIIFYSALLCKLNFKQRYDENHYHLNNLTKIYLKYITLIFPLYIFSFHAPSGFYFKYYRFWYINVSIDFPILYKTHNDYLQMISNIFLYEHDYILVSKEM